MALLAQVVRNGFVVFCVLLAACSDTSVPEIEEVPDPIVEPEPKEMPYELLSEYALFVGNGASQIPAEGVMAYQPISPLFSDYSTKYRFIYVPQGMTIGYHNEEKWDFPAGSILVKTFSYLNKLT